MRRNFTCLTLAVLCGLGAEVAAAQDHGATLTPDQEVPPTPSTATGAGTFTLGADLRLAFDVTIAGLHGPETACWIHGPASPGSNATPLFALPLGSRKTGSVGPLTPAQRADLEAGLMYVNVHTTHHPNGEIRGQIRSLVAVAQPTWAAVKLVYRAP